MFFLRHGDNSAAVVEDYEACTGGALVESSEIGRHGGSLEGEKSDQQAGERPSDKRSKHGNVAVAPVGAPFAGDGKNRVGDARAEVAGWIDGVAGGAAEGETNAPNETAYKKRPKTCYRPRGGNSFGENSADDETRTNVPINSLMKFVLELRIAG